MTDVAVVAAISSRTAVAILIIAVMLATFVVIFGWSLVQSRKAAMGEAAGAARPERPVDETVAAPRPRPVARRDFLRRSLLVSFAVFGAEFGGATLAYLWPNLKGGFGSLVVAGNISDIKSFISQNKQPYYFGAGRFYLVPYEVSPTPSVYASIVSNGLMALYQKCVHLGCRVPFCQTSQWFECPCHGSKYNEAGEYQLGPAPRGLDRFKVVVDAKGNVTVDTSNIITGPPRGTDTTHQPPEGAFCVGGAAGG